jgi:LysM repeat protein
VLVAEPITDVTPLATYTVKSGDSLWSIAKKNHLTVAEIATANGLPVGAKLSPGQKLVLPGKSVGPGTAPTVKSGTSVAPKTADLNAAAAPKASDARASTDAVKHVVKSGESLNLIARKYGVKVGDIAEANNIRDPAKIALGTELIIPGWQTPPVGKSGKAAGKAGANKGAEPKVEAPVAPPVVPTIPFDSPISPAPKP